nr:preprotein translocase subunit YajC [Actinomycetales bacterium]
MELLLPIAIFGLLIWWMSRSSKKQRAAQEEARDSAITVGTTVQTIGGFLGTVVDIDGDAITLESPSGIETLWHRQAVRSATEIPYASTMAVPLTEEPVEDEAAQPTISTIENPIENALDNDQDER